MSLSESISRVIKSARELKSIADELGNRELKSRLLEEIDRLQELKEALAESGELAQFSLQQASPDSIPARPSEPASSDSATHVIVPAVEGETYKIHVDGEPAEATATTVANQKESGSERPSEEGEDERYRRGEALLRKLEPQQQQILKKMNDILTEEQKIRKQAITREGQSAGKSAAEIQQALLASLDLTDKQKQLMAAARKELHDVQTEIVRQVDGLLTVEQRKRQQKTILKELAARH
ncbi:MAG TPA: hypothetical protein VMM56_15805 [Planctomycetaceae bacterium]|nr:hypothetical protein [Planctomycetaceae bacterium]